MFCVKRSLSDHSFLKANLAACIAFAAVVVSSLAVFPPVVSAQMPTDGKHQTWNQLVEAARREGKVVVYRGTGFGPGGSLREAFGKAYPGIKVFETIGRGSQRLNRIFTERRANMYIPDVLIGGPANPVISMKPVGAVAPLKPILMLPEVLDKSAWLQKRLWWADGSEPYTTLMFIGYVQPLMYVNPKMVDPSQFKSYWDLLDPKWKGKIVSGDIRRSGKGASISRFLYKHPQLGPRYLTRLYREMDITLSSDHRQMVDWLARGRYPLAIFLSASDSRRAHEQGLPVVPVSADQLKEGAPVAPGSGNVSLMNPAPHPNAAKLFINWLLSRAGQITWQQAVRLPSLRVDIPKTGLFPADIPKLGKKYISVGTEEYLRIGRSGVVGDLIKKATAKADRQ